MHYIPLNSEPRKEYRNAFSYATFTESTMPCGILKHADEADRLLFFLSKGYLIKEGKTRDAINIIISQYQKDLNTAFIDNPYTNTIPADYIDGKNRVFFQYVFYSKTIGKSILDFNPLFLKEIKNTLSQKQNMPKKKIILTKENVKAAETAMLLTWISDAALTIVR